MPTGSNNIPKGGLPSRPEHWRQARRVDIAYIKELEAELALTRAHAKDLEAERDGACNVLRDMASALGLLKQNRPPEHEPRERRCVVRWPWRRREALELENLRLRNRVAFLESELRQAVAANVDLANALRAAAVRLERVPQCVLSVYRSQLAARDAAAVRRRERGA